MQVERVYLDGIARPGDARAARRDLQPREALDGAARRVVPGQPLRIEEHAVALQAGDGLVHAHDVPLDIRCIDVETNLARIRDVHRRCDGRRGRGGRGSGARVRGENHRKIQAHDQTVLHGSAAGLGVQGVKRNIRFQRP